LQYAYHLWYLYHALRDDNGARQDRCPVVAADEVFRLDLLDRGLSEFSFVTGEAYDYQGKRLKSANGVTTCEPGVHRLLGEAGDDVLARLVSSSPRAPVPARPETRSTSALIPTRHTGASAVCGE